MNIKFNLTLITCEIDYVRCINEQYSEQDEQIVTQILLSVLSCKHSKNCECSLPLINSSSMLIWPLLKQMKHLTGSIKHCFCYSALGTSSAQV